MSFTGRPRGTYPGSTQSDRGGSTRIDPIYALRQGMAHNPFFAGNGNGDVGGAGVYRRGRGGMPTMPSMPYMPEGSGKFRPADVKRGFRVKGRKLA